jgi:hypothetical protein
MKRMKLFVVVALALSICLPGAVMASPIGVFSGTVESFERIAPATPSNGTGGVQYYNNFTIGHGAVTTFTSGVTFTAPLLPTGSYWYGDPFINDFAITLTASNYWNDYITVDDVPGGAAWVGAFYSTENPSVVKDTLEFTLPSPMTRVGAYMDGPTYAGPLTMMTYDVNGTRLDTRTVASVDVGAWKDNWIGSQIDSGQQPISKVVFSGNDWDFGVDNLTFSAAAVPIPPSALLLGSGLLGLVGMAWRRRQES